jgi:hypothetical protein
VVFLVVERVAGWSPAMLAAAAFALHPDVRLLRLLVMTESLAGLLFLLLVVLLHRRGRALVSGVVLGLLVLTRNEAITFIPCAVAVEAVLSRRGGRIAMLLLGCLLVLVPWWIRNYRLTGSPFFDLHYQVFATRPFAAALDLQSAADFSPYRRLEATREPGAKRA